MMSRSCSNDSLFQLRALVARQMGLFYSDDGIGTLENAAWAYAQSKGYSDLDSFLIWILDSPFSEERVTGLSDYLTVGETYFFRERGVFDVLQKYILPERIYDRRRSGNRCLRIWSAGCSSGEEPYSLAILLHRIIPDWDHWSITITATDINSIFLTKAKEGLYGPWSFRGAPSWLLSSYFDEQRDGLYKIKPLIQSRVNFSYQNMAKCGYPPIPDWDAGFDLIFCRNVLMYFSKEFAQRVIDGFSRVLASDGLLAVSSIEASAYFFSTYQPLEFPGTALFQNKRNPLAFADAPSLKVKDPEEEASFILQTNRPSDWPTDAAWETNTANLIGNSDLPSGSCNSMPIGKTECLHKKDSIGMTQPPNRNGPDSNPVPLIERIRLLANQGDILEALKLCEQALAIDSLQVEVHFLQGSLLLEQEMIPEAILAMERVIFLEPHFISAYLALGRMLSQQERFRLAQKQFRAALYLLDRIPGDEIIPETGENSAQNLKILIERLIQTGRVRP